MRHKHIHIPHLEHPRKHTHANTRTQTHARKHTHANTPMQTHPRKHTHAGSKGTLLPATLPHLHPACASPVPTLRKMAVDLMGQGLLQLFEQGGSSSLHHMPPPGSAQTGLQPAQQQQLVLAEQLVLMLQVGPRARLHAVVATGPRVCACTALPGSMAANVLAQVLKSCKPRGTPGYGLPFAGVARTTTSCVLCICGLFWQPRPMGPCYPLLRCACDALCLPVGEQWVGGGVMLAMVMVPW